MPKTEHRKNLTPTLIKGLKPASDGSRYQIMDAQVPGFGVRVTDTGDRTFILRTRYPGCSSPSRREIGNCADINLTDAREKARKWRSMVGLPSERKGKDVEREIRRDLLPRWKDKPITSITDLDVIAVIKAKMPDGKVGARNLLALIKRFFRWVIAQRVYGVVISPCVTLRASAILGEMKGSRDRILSEDEIFAYWRAATRMSYPYGPFYQGRVLTALRLSELADATKPEFDSRTRVWVIPGRANEGQEQRQETGACTC